MSYLSGANMSTMQAVMGVTDSILLHNIIQATEADENLSMLPDEFKDAAIEIMFQDALAKKNNTEVPTTEINITNKRSRCDLTDLSQTAMDCEGTDAE